MARALSLGMKRLGFVLIVVVTACQQADELVVPDASPPSDGGSAPACTMSRFTVARDFAYSEIGRLDLYLPEEPAPLLVFFHEDARESCPGNTFAACGYAVACVDYRRPAPGCAAVFPAPLEDAAAALAWLRTAAPMLRFDGTRVAVMGASWGGHLAARVGVATPDLRAVVDWFGPVDPRLAPPMFTDDACTASMDDLVARYGADAPGFAWTVGWGRLLGAALTEETLAERAPAASPLPWIDASDPAFLVVHGDADLVVPPAQSQALADALAAAGVPVRLVVVPGLGHGYRSNQQVDMRVLVPTLEFLRDRLRP